jgi:hypothetical protein
MERLDGWLRARPLILALLLALGSVLALDVAGILSENVMPFGDGEHYLLRAFTLYGFLHSGQWAQFWDLLTLPRQSIAPLHYWIFFLLPRAWAGVTSYGLIQAVTTYGLLAWGVWGLCRALERPAWTPALFLFCATQNISLEYNYFYFVDLPFYALGTVVLAWQVSAWREDRWPISFRSGLGAGLLFWVKPANAVIFTATYLLAEAIWIAVAWHRARPTGAQRPWLGKIARHLGAIAAGFMPVTLLALACGGIQAIARLVDANEGSGIFVTHLECTGLLRFFYFPLCLSFFYHVGLLVMIGVTITLGLILVRSGKEAAPPSPFFPGHFLLPLLIAYLVLGEFFSFGMANKEMRSLLLVLPVLWLAIFWLLDRWRLRPALVFLGAAFYAACGYSQIFFNTFDSHSISTQSYQLQDDWLERLPQSESTDPEGMQFTRDLFSALRRNLPDGGKVAIGTEQMFVTSESLAWVAQKEITLDGGVSPYEFHNFLTHDGKGEPGALLDSRGIFLCSFPEFQYSPEVSKASGRLAQYTHDKWENSYAKITPIEIAPDGLVGFLIVPKEPLDEAHLTELLQGANVPELPAHNEFTLFNDRRLSWAECLEILRKWKEKRFGR